MKQTSLLLCALLLGKLAAGQLMNQKKEFTRQDSLRGTLNPNRSWWDVQKYIITVTPDFEKRSISGGVGITYKRVAEPAAYLQLDLQQPMQIDSIWRMDDKGTVLERIPGSSILREGNAWLVDARRMTAAEGTLMVYFHGIPRPALNPPWDGGWIWKKDKQNRPWMSVACQGLGASVWYPCKDHQSDEPDRGATLLISAPDTLVAVANGRPSVVELTMRGEQKGYRSTTWKVRSPINNYNIVPYIGKYVSFSDTLMGEEGKLDLHYWVLDYNLEKAKKQFEQVKPMLRALEYWFGPYPFYTDGYKLVESPHLGMEHQSAIAYGNQYKNGYLGTDLSGTGRGKNWDYIIVHESGHEWFGNNITTQDIADMWVQEGFTDYSETLFIEYYQGKAAASEYVIGLRRNIQNDKPIIGPYGVNEEGSGDMYFKGANLIHTIRQIINDDKLFRDILRGLNRDFRHKTVTTRQVEEYINRKSGKDFTSVFDQYLRNTRIPELELQADGDKLKFRWTNCADGFNMPVRLSNGQWIYPTTTESKIKLEGGRFDGLTVDPNFYVRVKS